MIRRIAFVLVVVSAIPMSAHAAGQEAELQVSIEGISGPLHDNAAAQLSILRAAEGTVPATARVRWLHERASGEISLALQPFGHYRVRVDASLQHEGLKWIATYRVDPGDRIPISALDLQISGEAGSDAAFESLRTAFPLKAGEPLEHARYESAKRSLLALAAERGYFDALLTRSEVRVSLEKYQAEVVLHLDSGPRYRFGEVTFDDVELDQTLLQRYQQIREGEPFSSLRLLELQQDLIDSDHFAAVQVEPHRDQVSGLAVSVHVHLTLRKANRYTAGIGFGTDTGVRGKLGLERRRVNRHGHHLDAELIGSGLGGKVAAQYAIPGRHPQSDTLLLHASAVREIGDILNLRSLAVGASLQHVLGRWQRIYDLELQREEFELGDEQSTSVLLIPGLQLSRTLSDNRFDTQRGSALTLRVRGAHRSLLSDLSFVQAHITGNWIRPLGKRNRITARGELGATWTDDFDNLPASLRFFTGGDRTVRGYALDTIGPVDADSHVIGGHHLAIGSLEIDHRFTQSWSGALFVDRGDAFDDASPVWRTGAGVGLRWHSPIGPLRIDLATGLDVPGDNIRLHLTIGPDF